MVVSGLESFQLLLWRWSTSRLIHVLNRNRCERTKKQIIAESHGCDGLGPLGVRSSLTISIPHKRRSLAWPAHLVPWHARSRRSLAWPAHLVPWHARSLSFKAAWLAIGFSSLIVPCFPCFTCEQTQANNEKGYMHITLYNI